MRLTTFSDYTLRVLMYLALDRSRRVTIAELGTAFGISENHLMKVVQDLSAAGVVETVRGRGGGLRLARASEEIRLGAVIRRSEGEAPLVECMSSHPSTCRIAPVCTLKGVLSDAFEALYERLDRTTLADLVENRSPLLRALSRTESTTC
ncbi:MAG: Rrf2 family transcriptional regulator [Myxococcaceae bacterium]